MRLEQGASGGLTGSVAMDVITQEYQITAEPARKLVRIGFFGFWDAAVMARFIGDEQVAVASLGCAPGEHLVLADVSSGMLQSQQIVSAFNHFISTADRKAARLVFMTGTGAMRMQARRLLLRPGIGVAATIEEAEAFLFAPATAAATRAA